MTFNLELTLFHSVVEYFALQHLPDDSLEVCDVSRRSCHEWQAASFDFAFEDVAGGQDSCSGDVRIS